MRRFRRVSGFLVLPALLFGQQWRPLGPFGGTALTVSADPARPGYLVAGARHSLVYRSTDAGRSWSRIPFPRHFHGDIRTIWIDPADSTHMIAGVSLTGSPSAGAYESKDDGATWKPVAELAGLSVEHVASHPANPKRLGAATRRGMFLSADGGQSWTRATPETNHELHATTAVAFDPGGDEVVYSGTTHLPWRSTDGGTTWQRIAKGMIDDSDVFSLTVGRESPKQLFLSACSGMYTSADGGDSWRRFRGLPMTHRRTHILRQDPARPATLYAGTTLGLFKSEDGGVTWRETNKFAVNSLTFDPVDSRILYLATDGAGLQKSADGGKTWVDSNRGFVSRRAGELTFAKSGVTVRLPEGAVLSADGGTTWRKAPAVAAATTRTAPVRKPAGLAPAYTHQLASRGSQWLAAGGAGLWWSQDNGATWQRAAGIDDASVSAVAYHPSNPSNAYAIQFGRLYQSADGGKTWAARDASLGDATVDKLWTSPLVGDVLFASTADSGVFSLQLSNMTQTQTGIGAEQQ